MTPDTPPAPVADVVLAGERLRMELLDALRGAGEGERAAVLLEVAMFYGQAFARVAAALTRPLEPKSRAMGALHAAIRGRAAFRVWLDTQTPAAGVRHLDRMEGHWSQIIRLVLREGAE